MKNNQQQPTLQGNMGVPQLVMSVLAFSGPLCVAAAFITAVLMDSGSAAPWVYIICFMILLFFSVGFSKMGTVMSRPGGFYSYITDGLGKRMGMTGAFLSAAGYMTNGLFGPPLLAIYLQQVIENTLGGPHIPWYVLAIACVLISMALAYRRIDLSAKVMFYVMLCEVALIVIFDVAAFLNGAPANAGGGMFTLPDFGSGTFGVALLLGFGNFLGFEATVIYREECRDPQKTIPRATFIAVIGIGIMYSVTAWAFVTFYGADNVQQVATNEIATMFSTALGTLTAQIMNDIVAALACFSVFASMLSIHNVAARYLFSLGQDGVIPRLFGKVHVKHHSPYVAATFVGCFWVAMLVIFAASGKPSDYLYPLFSGSGVFLTLLVILLAAIAVPAYFKKNPQFKFSKFATLLAPIVGIIGLAFIVYMAVINFGALLGSTGIVTVIFFTGIVIYVIGSYCYSIYLEKRKPEIFAKIGRQDAVDNNE
ncbi:MAG: APC family permease [Bacillota bacterium]|nr:APC family permease [Bacillota bacterium]